MAFISLVTNECHRTLCLQEHGGGSYSQKHGQLTSCYTTEENLPPSPISQYLSVKSQGGVGLHEPSPPSNYKLYALRKRVELHWPLPWQLLTLTPQQGGVAWCVLPLSMMDADQADLSRVL